MNENLWNHFHITSDDVLCFGDIDFHEGSDDCKELDTFNWLEHLGTQGVGIPSRYNYDKHECTSPINKYLITDSDYLRHMPDLPSNIITIDYSNWDCLEKIRLNQSFDNTNAIKDLSIQTMIGTISKDFEKK